MERLLSLLSFGSEGWGDELAAGAWLTIRLAAATLPVGLAIGFLVALARRSRGRPLRVLSEAYTTIFRGLPELLTLFIVYYGGQMLLQAAARLFTDSAVEANGFVAGMIALGAVFGAYAAEAFTSAFKAIPLGQWEAGAALGLRRGKVMLLVILPQLIRIALPALANLWLVLLKDTALVSVVALEDLLRMSDVAARVSKEPFFFYLVACLLYLAMAVVSTYAIHAIERWARRGERRPAAMRLPR